MHTLPRSILFTAALLIAATLGCGTSRDGFTPSKLGQIELTPLTDGASPVTNASIQGKVALINFWATWCGPCVAEFPHLVQMTQGYRDRSDFVFLSVSTGHPPESLREQTLNFLKQHPYGIAVYADSKGLAEQAISGSVSTGAIPITVLVDRDGQIIDGCVGFNSAKLEEMKLRIASLLQAKSK